MGEISYMSPTRTDRIHFFTIQNSELFSKLGEISNVEGKENLKEVKISEGDYTIGVYKNATLENEHSIGMIVPNKEVRERYFRLALIAFFSGVLWMIIIGITIVGWMIAATMAGFGNSFLLAIMEPIGPWLLPIFGITTGIFGIPIFVIIVQFPLYNRNIARKAITRLKEITKSQDPEMSFHEIPVDIGVFDLTIGERVPEGFRDTIEQYLAILEITDGIDTVSYTLIDRP